MHGVPFVPSDVVHFLPMQLCSWKEPWEFSLIGKFFGKLPPLNVVSSWVLGDEHVFVPMDSVGGDAASPDPSPLVDPRFAWWKALWKLELAPKKQPLHRHLFKSIIMASSNRHWPSLFKSKPCNSHHQWQHDINPCHHKSPYTSMTGFEERSPEPKPRWNPKPEQIRILEAIFNSGMVNPPRDEIRKIRAQLQEYGQVGDANVFYWFQNRKSRSKNKQRHLQTARSQPPPPSSTADPSPPVTAATKPSITATVTAAATSSSSSSSDHSTGSDKTLLPPAASIGGLLPTTVHPPTVLPPPTSINPVYLHGPQDFASEPFLLQGQQGYCFSTAADMTGIIGVPTEQIYQGLWSELLGQTYACKNSNEEVNAKMQLHHLYEIGASSPPPYPAVTGASTTSATVAGVNAFATGATTAAAATTISEIQAAMGGGGGGPGSSTVFINEVPFEVAAQPLNLREAFGGEAILLDHSGHPVLTDEWGITVLPLQHGASYYLVLNYISLLSINLHTS
ncbi:WUSCHEL-related homeobox 9-like [Canna indica]|uniref:WUSCHEL-related homeobox 9-like n=1 Tax=Canna indica TaxID=4628 RepID=A0AAQ3KQ33_9LILI|nr:WUSCHEL-related homeobox 9-like [Canna indica]